MYEKTKAMTPREYKNFEKDILKNKSIEELIVLGSKDRCTTDPTVVDKPLVIRGIGGGKYMRQCMQNNRDFYYTDTGYLANFIGPGNPTGVKLWHRVVKNSVQHHTIRECPPDRWQTLIAQDKRLEWRGWKNYDKKILLVVPTPKSCKYYGIDIETWKNTTIEEIKKFSNLPIEIRYKTSRRERNNGYTIYKAFDSGVYATVTFNSIAALESVLYGIPAFVSVPCAASPLASTDLSQLANPVKPDTDLILKQCYSLAYGQFTLEEIYNGTAWKILKKF
jgi:hypothetical protein